jgi:hypothetical protein
MYAPGSDRRIPKVSTWLLDTSVSRGWPYSKTVTLIACGAQFYSMPEHSRPPACLAKKVFRFCFRGAPLYGHFRMSPDHSRRRSVSARQADHTSARASVSR